MFSIQLAVGTHLSEALAAENGTVGLGLEGHLGLAAAACAGSGEELTGAAGSVLAGVTAGLAALGLVLEAALCVESLLAGGEHELIAAFLTSQSLIFVHGNYLSSVVCSRENQSNAGNNAESDYLAELRHTTDYTQMRVNCQ